MPLRIRSHIVYPAKVEAATSKPKKEAIIRWTPEEDAMIRKCYPHSGSRILAAAMNRSYRAVQMRASTLGVPRA